MSGSLKEALAGILFPKNAACLSCGRESVTGSDGLCADCHEGIETFNAAPPPAETDGFSSVYVYNDVSGRMVRRLKYSGAKYIAKSLADRIILPPEWEIDCVVPVPIYFRRFRKRGYNQSELIAKHLCRRLGLKLETDVLVKTRETLPQTRLVGSERRRNLKGAFEADDAVNGKSVLLVDDVRTTGSTLSECAAELKRHGAKAVWAVTVCTARPE